MLRGRLALKGATGRVRIGDRARRWDSKGKVVLLTALKIAIACRGGAARDRPCTRLENHGEEMTLRRRRARHSSRRLSLFEAELDYE